ncbi:MAG: UDP-N-acetylmuramoyl-tripeptide--D-alanyl-D-alanine ligase [Bacteroidales bacterium]
MLIEKLYKLFSEHPVVTTDTRNCPPGSIFFALKGDRFNGNHYAMKALESGCAAAVVDEAEFATDPRITLVSDVLKALQELARHHRRTMKVPVIAITGTNGKTTTKELAAAVLSRKFNVLFTEGNLNNHIGVPLTLLRLTSEHDLAVVEMGANHPGDIKELVEIAEPNFGLITNVGKAHLEGFGSFEGVIRTKCEMYEYIRRTGGKIFLHNENTILSDHAKGIESILYGIHPRIYLHGHILSNNPFISFEWHTLTFPSYEGVVNTKLIGEYNFYNAIAAAAMGCYFGVAFEDISSALSEYVPSNNRSQLKITDRNHVVIDAYNANPTSMKASLRNFYSMSVKNKLLILGDMLELGEHSAFEHQQVVNQLEEYGFDEVLLVGENFMRTRSSLKCFDNCDSLMSYVKDQCYTGRYILIKGSRGIALERALDIL